MKQFSHKHQIVKVCSKTWMFHSLIRGNCARQNWSSCKGDRCDLQRSALHDKVTSNNPTTHISSRETVPATHAFHFAAQALLDRNSRDAGVHFVTRPPTNQHGILNRKTLVLKLVIQLYSSEDGGSRSLRNVGNNPRNDEDKPRTNLSFIHWCSVCLKMPSHIKKPLAK